MAALCLGAGAVPASGQTPCAAPEARQFDFWIGEWDIVNRQSPPGSPRWFETGRATNRVHAVVGGCGIVEHWVGETFQGHVLGFSIRAWDPRDERWHLVLLWPGAGGVRFGELRGGFHHGRGEFFTTAVGANGDSVVTRFAFADIGPDSFRWQDGTSTDGGATWASSWIMEFTRRDRLASGLHGGMAGAARRCPEPPHRAFDGQLGRWAGRRTAGGGAPVDIRVETLSILEGCAVVERAWAPDGSWERVAVRAFETEAGRWTEYALSSDDPVLRRWDGDAAGKVFTLREGGGPDRRRLRVESGGGWTWMVEGGPDDVRPLESYRATEPLGGRGGE